jgi:trimethylamine--corrinoid protein Co-methyltransferase
MCGMVRRLRGGFTVSPETLAYDVIAKVGPGGNYLMEDHTVERCRSEFWKPAVSDRGGLEAWMAGGRQDAMVRARARWQKLVLDHADPELDQVTRRQLHTYLQEHLS